MCIGKGQERVRAGTGVNVRAQDSGRLFPYGPPEHSGLSLSYFQWIALEFPWPWQRGPSIPMSLFSGLASNSRLVMKGEDESAEKHPLQLSPLFLFSLFVVSDLGSSETSPISGSWCAGGMAPWVGFLTPSVSA